MQEKNAEICRIPERIENLRERLGFPKDPALAEYIDVSVRTLYYARDDKQYSAKFERKLQAAERRAAAISNLGTSARDSPPTSGNPPSTASQRPEKSATIYPESGEVMASEFQVLRERMDALEGKMDAHEKKLDEVLTLLKKGKR